MLGRAAERLVHGQRHDAAQAAGKDDNGKTYDHIDQDEFFRRLDTDEFSNTPRSTATTTARPSTRPWTTWPTGRTCCWRSTCRAPYRCGTSTPTRC